MTEKCNLKSNKHKRSREVGHDAKKKFPSLYRHSDTHENVALKLNCSRQSYADYHSPKRALNLCFRKKPV